MSVLYNQFSVIEVITDLKTKTIIIATNFKVDPSTVDLNTVSLYDYSAGTGQLTDYSLHVDGKNICIILRDYPAAGTKYFLKITDIYDALNRKINYAYNDYIVFDNEVLTQVEVLSPGFREVLTQNTIDIRIRITDPLDDGKYRIQISTDNVYFKILTTIMSNATSDEIVSSDNIATIIDNESKNGELRFKTNIDYNGQLYIRARAERTDNEVGRWSETSSFTINTISADSMDTTFLEESLTTFDLFPDETVLEPLGINEKSTIADVTDAAFYIEFNKDIKLPEDYKVDEDGYVTLGIVTGFRKGLK
jgi:hypothetical protein